MMSNKKSKRNGNLSAQEKLLLKKLYRQGGAAFGSSQSLQKISKQSKQNVEKFLQSTNADTKYGTYPFKFPRLKVIAYNINEIWSMDLALVDKLAKYNRGIKHLMIAVDVLSRYVRVEPLKSKEAKETGLAVKKIFRKKQPEKIWTDKGKEFKGDFKKLCDRKGIGIYHTESGTKFAFAERTNGTLKSII